MKGPGKAYRKGITLPELIAMFPDDAAAERWFEENRWGEAGKPSHCPMCGCADHIKPTPGQVLPYWCGGCRRRFSVRTGTIMHRSHIPLQKWAIAVYQWATSLKGVSSMKLHRDLGITRKSAYFMAQRLREAWSDMPHGMAGPVEADESCFGGLRKNMSKRKELGGTGRGAVGKAIVAGIKDRKSRKVAVKVLSAATGGEVKEFVRSHAKPGATLCTDEARACKGVPEYEHEAVNHSTSEYVRDQAHTNGIESFRALLSRAYHGIFHHISPKHLHRYIAEFATRHNLRRMDTLDIMRQTVAMMVGKRLTCQALTSGQ